jgi:hypothetical protein
MIQYLSRFLQYQFMGNNETLHIAFKGLLGKSYKLALTSLASYRKHVDC